MINVTRSSLKCNTLLRKVDTLVRKGHTNVKNRIFRKLDGEFDSSLPSFQENNDNSKQLSVQYEKLMEVVRSGGGAKAIERHTMKNKKLLASDRLKLLLDDASKEFLELSALAGMKMEYGDVPRATSIVGIGKVAGRWCMVVSNDATVKGGTQYPISVQKQLRAQEIAQKLRLPCIYLVDTGGAFLPLQSNIFPDKNDGGRVFYNEAVMKAEGIPQIALVCGNCTAGGAYVPTMAEEAVIVREIGTIFLGGPPLVQAATGEIVSPEDLGGADLHCKISGCADHYAENEQEAIEITRGIIASLNDHGSVSSAKEFDEPCFDIEELDYLAPANVEKKIEIRKVIARITDGSTFQEFKTKYGPNICTGFATVNGHLIGLIGNEGAIDENAATKASHFIQLCDYRNMPIIILQNTSDNDNSKSSSIKAQAQMMAAMATCKVPKVSLLLGSFHGTDSLLMCGRSFEPAFAFSWPNAIQSFVNPTQFKNYLPEFPAGIPQDEANKKKEKVLSKLQQQSTAIFAASRLWNDGIILPSETRSILAKCLDILSNGPYQTSAHRPVNTSVVRM